ncbi:hypothetical protein [Asticcacaulis endophyticus]|uniref:Bacteriophage Rz lysis protein n=1 Tax=Asticcacaulis endophyticus TaxID=1395890 RepID=A0A918UTH9_9CAUL|nr:hypothetical protein [Asticcacaulis endophyticus]GGZ32024.1 hypothetical protein GCM10011273_17570 [Asticcacaulis endophyticus]
MIDILKSLGLCLAMVTLTFGAGYLEGSKDAYEKAELASARQAEAAMTSIRRLQSHINLLSHDAAIAETQRQTAVKEIRRETERIIVRPVYRTICVDADGLRILDQAADLANAKPAGNLAAPADTAAGTTESPPPGNSQIGMTLSSSGAVEQMTAADCVQSMLDLYDTSGQIRAQLVALQSQVTLTQEARPE